MTLRRTTYSWRQPVKTGQIHFNNKGHMDTRELTAYALIALLIISIGLAAFYMHRKRKNQRKLRGYRR